MTWLISNWIGIVIGLLVGWHVPMPVWATAIYDKMLGRVTTFVKTNVGNVVNPYLNVTPTAPVVASDSTLMNPTTTADPVIKTSRPDWMKE